jgi:hypothetical protein
MNTTNKHQGTPTMKRHTGFFASRASAAVLAGLLALGCRTAEAAIVVTWSDVDSNLVATWSGSIDLSNLTNVGSPVRNSDGNSSAIASILGFGGTTFGFRSAAVSGSAYIRYESFPDFQVTSPPFDQLNQFFGVPSASTGDFFEARSSAFGDNNYINLPEPYTSGAPLSGTVTFAGQSIAGVFGTNLTTAPTVMFSIGGNDVSYAVIPEPSSLGLAGLGLGLGFGFRRRRNTDHRTATDATGAPLMNPVD